MATNSTIQDPPLGSTNRSTGTTPRATFQLSAIALPEFNGDPYKWPPFWEIFEVAVHKITPMPAIEKFSFLKSCLRGAAEELLEGVPLTEANYKFAVDKLRSRFGRTEVVFGAHMSKLTNLMPVTNNEDLVAIRHLVDQVETDVMVLEGLGTDISTYEKMLVPIFREKLPLELDLAWQESGKRLDEFNELLKFVDGKIRNREECALRRMVASAKGPANKLPASKTEQRYRGM
jgi:Protein of unknown function (DUF1759)